MWAFALHDQETQEVFLSRDPFGEKPLLLARRGDQLVFASEMGALRSALGELAADPVSLLSFLALGRLPSATAEWYAGVDSLAPGHNLVFDLATRSIEISPYFDLDANAASGPGVHALGDDLQVRFDAVLERAVARTLRSDVPVGSY